jgi:DNA-binding response OmpR family regulator
MTESDNIKTQKIVFIDDDEEMVKLLELFLKKSGFEAIGAQSGSEGLALIKYERPDVVLLDIMMPDMDGWEVYQRMKADEIMRTIPVIVVTCKAQAIDKVLAMNIAKVNDYITKPFSPTALNESINKVLAAA